MYNVALCDDEKIILDLLGEQLAEIAGNKLGEVFSFESVNGLVELISKGDTEIHIVFLDIKLGKSNGIDIASKLREINPDLQIIFISGYDDYYLDVYNVDHLFFLRKPIKLDALSRALARAENRLAANDSEMFFAKSKKFSINLRLCDILFFEKDLRRILVHSFDETLPFYGKFDDITPQLNSRFIRCHNSYIVNIANVKRMEGSLFIMANDSFIPISRTRAHDARTAYLDYLEG